MRRFWLIFAEFVTITLAIVFVVTLIRPDWNPWRRNVVEIRESSSSTGGLVAVGGQGGIRTSYAEASKRAMTSVVNISSSRDARTPSNHPLANDPLFQRFFGQPNGGDEEPDIRGSLGSGMLSIINATIASVRNQFNQGFQIDGLLNWQRFRNAIAENSSIATNLLLIAFEQDSRKLDYLQEVPVPGGGGVPAIQPPFSTVIAAGALVTLSYSFLVDTLWLWRHAA